MKITDKEVLELLVSKERYSTLEGIRGLIMYIYNFNAYKKINLFSLIRNADREHKDLILSIMRSCASDNESEAFFIEHKVAPLLIENGIDEKFVDEK